jgi:methyl-accepting chemotaxis protein
LLPAIATGNADLSQQTHEQASSLQQTAASMEEVAHQQQRGSRRCANTKLVGEAGITMVDLVSG